MDKRKAKFVDVISAWPLSRIAVLSIRPGRAAMPFLFDSRHRQLRHIAKTILIIPAKDPLGTIHLLRSHRGGGGG